MRPLASSATPTEVSSAGSRRNRNRFKTAFTAGSLAKDPVALGRPEVPLDGPPWPGRALPRSVDGAKSAADRARRHVHDVEEARNQAQDDRQHRGDREAAPQEPAVG